MKISTNNAFPVISFLLLCFVGSVGAMKTITTPNPLISKGKTVKSSSSSNLTVINDGKFSSSGWSSGANSWVAINVGKGPSKVFVCWDSPMQIWSDSIALPLATGKSCWQTVNMPFEYTIATSDSSTTGADGQWTEAVSVKNNVVASRGHLVDFTGKSWIKMSIAKGSGQLDEIGVFDASNGLQDSWIFIGTSISQMAFRSNIPANGFCELINGKHLNCNPAIIRGGIGCIYSANLADDVSKYVANAGNVHYWAIEMGTNDNWDKIPAATFKANLKRVIDTCKMHQIEPVIARMIATNEAKVGWQVSQDYLDAIDNLTLTQELVPGPDLYNYFLTHQSELNSDGVHPSATGAASIQRLWADKMDSIVYKTTAIRQKQKAQVSSTGFRVESQGSRITLSAVNPGDAIVFDINGRIVKKLHVRPAGVVSFDNPPGLYVIKFASTNDKVRKIQRFVLN